MAADIPAGSTILKIIGHLCYNIGMTGVENRPDYIFGIGARILNSRLADIARDILPEAAKNALHRVVLDQRQYLLEPSEVKLAGIVAKFWIRNYNDWYRIGPDFE